MDEELSLDEYGNPPQTLSPDHFRPPAPEPAPVTRREIQLDESGNPPAYLTPDDFFDTPGTSSRYGAFGRGAAEGVIPGVAGMGGGILAGAGTGALLGAAGFNPFTVGAGAVVGGVLGGVGTGWLGSTAQNWLLEQTGQRDDPTSMFSRQQVEADRALFPYSRFAGEMGPSLMTLRPGGTWGQRVASGVIGGGVGGVADYVETGKVDPYKVAMGAAAGAALPNINRPTSNLLAGAAPRSWQPHMPNYDPASRTSTRDEGYYLPRAPRPEGPIQPYGPQRPPPPEPPMPGTGEGLPGTSPQAPRGVPPSPAPNDPAMPGVGTNLPGTTPAPGEPLPRYAPPPEEVFGAPDGARPTSLPGTQEGRPGTSYAGSAEAVSLQRQIDAVRAQIGDPHTDPVMREHWGAYARTLRERQIAMNAGLSDAQLQASQGAGPRNTPELVARANDITTVSAGVAHENQKVSVPSAGNPTGAPMLAREAARPNDPTRNLAKAAVRTAPGAPTVPTTTVVRGNVSPELAVAAKAAQPAPAAPTPAAAPPVAPAAPPSAAAARPAVAAPVTPPTARPAARARPTRAEAEAQLAKTQELSRSNMGAPAPAAEDARIAANNRRIAELEAAMAARAQPPAAPAVTAPVAPAPVRPVATAAQRQAHAAAVEQQVAQAKAMGSRTPAPKPAATETAIAASMRKAEAKAAAAPVIPREPPAVPVAKRPTLTLPAKKETIGQKLTKAAKKLAKEEKGSLSIGALTRRSTEPITKEQALRQLSRRFMPTPGMRPHEIADLVTSAAEGDARYALTLMNRKMTESRGWALKQDVIKARDILYKRAEAIEARAEPSPEVPMVPGKTREDLKPKPPKEEVAEKPFAAPGKRTQLVTTDTGEVRKPITFREEPKPAKPHGLDNYAPEEKSRFMDAIEALPQDKQVEALALTKAVPKEKVLANLDRMSDFLERERAGRTVESRKMETGKGARDLQDKAHKEGILAAYDKAVADNPRPTGRDETLKETIERATKIVKATSEEINKAVAQLTLDRPKFAHKFTGALDVTRLANPPPATKVVRAARELLAKPTAKQKTKFDTEEVLALAPEAKEAGGGLTEGTPETSPATETLAGPRYEARVDPDSPTFTSDHKDLVDMLNGMSDRAHAMMEDAYGSSIADEVNKKGVKPLELKAELLGALSDAQDARNKYAHTLETYPETLVKTTPVSDRAGIARVEQTGRFKPTKPADYQNLTEAERKAAPVRGVQDVTIETYKQIRDAITEFFGKKALPGKLAKGEIGGVSPEKSEKWLAQAGRILGELPHDYRGSLDVSKIFDWIDKVTKKFRPDREPMVPTGMTRLYRAGNDEPWSIRSMVEKPTKYADIPTSVIDQVRVDGLAGVEGKAAKRLADRWAREIAVNPDAPDARRSFQPEDTPVVDFLRRLWADESGALSVGKLPNWVTGAAARARSHYVPDASPAVMDYMKKIGKDATIMGTRIARKIQDTIYGAKAATMPDTKKPPTQAESGQMYRAWENNKLNALPPRLRDYYNKHVEPIIKKAEATYDELREIMERNKFHGYKDMPERVDNGPEYAKFIFRRQNIPFDENTGFDAITNRSRLSLWTQSVEPRKWFALQQDGTKAREIFHVNDEGNAVLWKDGHAGKRIAVPDGVDPSQVGSRIGDKLVDNAKIDEIMQHARDYDEAGGQTKKFIYHDNPMFTASDAYVGLSQSLERAKFLDKLVNDVTFQNYMSARTESAAEKKWGKGNFAETDMPHFRKMGQPIYFPKQVAWALDDAVKTGFNYGSNSFMEKLARFNQATLKPFYFLGPEVHVFNVLDKLIVGRGFDNLNIQKSWRNMSESLRDVRNQGPMMTMIMEGGGNPMFAHSMTQRAYPNLGSILGVEVAQRPWKWDPLRRIFGKDIKPGWERVYQKSNDMMWWQSDVLYQMMFRDNLDRHGGGHKEWSRKFAELEKLDGVKNPTAEQIKQRNELTAWKQELARKAVTETEKVIDGYVVPTTMGKVLGLEGTDAGRFIQKIATDPAFTNFGRFSYGLFKALANITKNMAGQNENLSAGHSAALGFSQAAMLLFTANVLYPMLSKAYQQAPWAKPESEVEKRGVTSLAMAGPDLIRKGVKDGWSKIAQRIYAPSTPVSAAMELWANRDFGGRAIFESGKGWGEVPGQAAEYAVSKLFSPVTGVSRAATQEGPGYSVQRFLESNFGVKTPTDKQIKYEAQRDKTLLSQGKTRERHPRGVIEAAGSAIHRAVRGYEEGGYVKGDDPPFDAEGEDYDYRGAHAAGIKPDETGHWASRDPESGLILKGRGHETFSKTLQGEEEAGYEISKKDGRYYSAPKRNRDGNSGVIPMSED